jgi:peptide/nickel transport system ATP-binding protein
MTLLAVEGLRIARAGQTGGRAVVADTDLALEPGETLGIAGESGCGKSTLLLALTGIVKPGLRVSAGTVRLSGTDILSAPPEDQRRLRGPVVALVPQNATLSLTEAMEVHDRLSPDARAARVTELFARVRLPEPDRIGHRFPHELSGGQMQRVAIAMALACEPRLLLLDEPTTGLDVSTQAGILDLLDALRRETGMAMVCVSHDIGVLARLTARVAVMYAGRVVEDRPVAALLGAPAHPYARALLASVPHITVPAIPPSIPGRPPAPGSAEDGCAFAPRCLRVHPACADIPVLRPAGQGGQVACHAPETSPLPRLVPAPLAAAPADGPPVLQVQDLGVRYGRPSLAARLLRRPPPSFVVEGVTFDLAPGEILGLVGESGSGKSTILRAIAGLWPRSAGRVILSGSGPLAAGTTRRDRAALQKIQVVFQNPDASLNPRQTVREILAQPLRLYFNAGPAEVEDRGRALMADVRLDPAYLDRRPGQLSGGERQRVALARAFAARPEVILCDEVTSALDVSVQASVLALISDLCRTRGTACLFVAHDLAVVASLCDRVAVLHEGRIVECGPAREVCSAPRHAYTAGLVAIARGHAAPGMPTSARSA